jgi:hypothetical protein
MIFRPHVWPSYPTSIPLLSESTSRSRSFHCAVCRRPAFLCLVSTIMGRWQPYLYNEQRTSQYGEPEVFNPRAVTQASRQPPSPRKKQEGPLINFNKHPDSYLVLPYGKNDAKPMWRKTKVVIRVARWFQQSFRIATLLGAIGALLCGIFIKGAQTTEGYIIRIPVRRQGVDVVAVLTTE